MLYNFFVRFFKKNKKTGASRIEVRFGQGRVMSARGRVRRLSEDPGCWQAAVAGSDLEKGRLVHLERGRSGGTSVLYFCATGGKN